MSLIADVVNRALAEYEELPEDSEIRGAVVIFDVMIPDPTVPAEPFTTVVWRCTQTISTAHAVGMLTLALEGMKQLHAMPPEETDD